MVEASQLGKASASDALKLRNLTILSDVKASDENAAEASHLPREVIVKRVTGK
ncbi:MAG: hypothetical protein UR89_C0021G0020 [Candidatus Roizmanbacteria bacterium GW2011_GWA2_35_8]|uniref:Uncharacterized protein n=1 Tax=Candidatus Roizmanbacteria bacterium GW2011_GWA2_35_8 TaxID=1618479 RepID=A0A0G0CZS0_9BACT|nr:MAG: hypothetical protein UR89_C0021G0020 [Candidatus Roizmanbacteria bacterium GW2011_GWA2_35_8]